MRYLIPLLVSLAVSGPSWAEDSEEKPCEEKKEKKWSDSLPPLKTGFLVDLDPSGRDGFFYFGFEIAETELFSQRWSVDVGVASGRVVTGLGLGLWFDGAVGPFVWGGYNISENSAAWGIGLNMLKL